MASFSCLPPVVMARSKAVEKPFRFLDLPAEIRVRIYELHLDVGRSIQLEAANVKEVRPRLNILFVSRQLYQEAYRVFYSANTFRIFSTNGKHFQTKWPLLVHFPRAYRNVLTTLELRLGPGWTKPPKSWVITPKFGLKDCKNLRTLKIFIELDPASNPINREWLKYRSLYTDFCVPLVAKLYDDVPTLSDVIFDGYPSVEQDGDLMTAFLAQAREAGKRVSYGPERGWSTESLRTLELAKVERQLSELSLSPLWPAVEAF